MGVVFFLFLFPLLIVIYGFQVVISVIPYIMIGCSLFWLCVGLIVRHILRKHGLSEKYLNHKKKWVRVLADVIKWLIRLDIYGNLVLIVIGVILAIVLLVHGITPLLIGQ